MRISDWSSDVCSSDLFAQAGEQGCCARFETCIQRRIGQLAQDRQARAHRQRIAGQRAGLIDRAEWCELFHHRALAAERADRQTAADDLAERDQIRLDAVQAAGATRADATTGHHLVAHPPPDPPRTSLPTRTAATHGWIQEE